MRGEGRRGIGEKENKEGRRGRKKVTHLMFLNHPAPLVALYHADKPVEKTK